MTKKYSQLTLEQRYQIDVLKKAGYNQSEIARSVNCNRSTICHEFKRNIPHAGTGSHLYVASKAQKKTDLRHTQKFKLIVFSEEMKGEALYLMETKKYSPELISAQWNKDEKPRVSHETIYKWLWACKFGNQKKDAPYKWLHLHLKHSHRRSRRGNYKTRRGIIAHRVSIENRAPIVARRTRKGDLEVDLIIGKKHQSGLLVTLDRVTLMLTIDKIKSRHPKHIKKLLLKRLSDKMHLKTITFDNDHAFGLHYELAKELKVKTYFTRPYTSQDKGSIENRNGIIRRFYPKKTDFNQVTAEDVKRVETLINDRPIRKYGYKTANEVHLLKSPSVALIA